MAADGIVPERFFKAGVALARSYDYRYQVELVDLETVSEGMRELILAEGVLLNDWTGSASAH